MVLPPNGEAEALGIVLIHQEFNLAEHLTVIESFFLGREITRFGLLDRKYMRAETRKALDVLGSHVDRPMRRISTLSVADKQMVEIAKAISRDARVADHGRADRGAVARRDADAVRADPRLTSAASRSSSSRTSSTR